MNLREEIKTQLSQALSENEIMFDDPNSEVTHQHLPELIETNEDKLFEVITPVVIELAKKYALEMVGEEESYSEENVDQVWVENEQNVTMEEIRQQFELEDKHKNELRKEIRQRIEATK